uniref:Uncharacterized protein n=1 Tax=Podoviridae sp. ctZ5d16 TaxID=2825257 RepID=A0A8S5Q9M3_9CAUD|nr:MAG TPA: hypothetical protein [Podoviridae sp. ctZ5d16]
MGLISVVQVGFHALNKFFKHINTLFQYYRQT